MAQPELVDVITLLTVFGIASSIIMAIVEVPSLASDPHIVQLLYVIVTGIFSVISFTVGKNTKRS